MLSPRLTTLDLSHISSLVELPCSFQNLNQLKELCIIECINLETLHTGINLPSLQMLDLNGCSRLKSFPDISTNISRLYLNQTGIEEVPWWIQKFRRLESFNMRGCNNLIRVSLNISKLKHLTADFSECGALTDVSWNGTPEELALAMATDNTHSNFFEKAKLIFINCFKLDIEALLQQPSVFLPSMILPGEQVPSYFTHRDTTGTSLINFPSTHPSLSQSFLRCRICFTSDTIYNYTFYNPQVRIMVRCRFIDRVRNRIDSSDWVHGYNEDELTKNNLVISNCYFNLPYQLNYDQVDVQFQIESSDSKFKVKGWGIQVLSESEYCTPFSGTVTCDPKRVKVKLALVMLLFFSFIVLFLTQNT